MIRALTSLALPLHPPITRDWDVKPYCDPEPDPDPLILRPDLHRAPTAPTICCTCFLSVCTRCHPPGGATALVAGIAKPLPRWSGFVLVPVVALSSVRAPCTRLPCQERHGG